LPFDEQTMTIGH